MNCGLTSEWFTINNIEAFFKIVKPGDKIEFRRGSYRHFAVYMGEGHVNGRRKHDCIVHVTTTEDTNDITTAGFASSVKRSGSSRLAPENIGKPYLQSICEYLILIEITAFRISNGMDEKWQPYTPQQIIQRALKASYFQNSYDLLTNNCEQFSNYCRYEKQRSAQSETLTIASTAALGSVALLAGCIGLASYLLGGSNKDKQKD